jgi:GTPase SAR1 family protein
MAAKVYISYRRDDSQYQARMIYAAFSHALSRGQVFMDVDSIPLGANFRKMLGGWVDECDVLLALIGHRWMDATDPKTGRSRLENPSDFVRIEIGRALARNIPVVPVLLDGAPMPDIDLLPDDLRPLARRQGCFIEHRTFDEDVERLVKTISQLHHPSPLSTEPLLELKLLLVGRGKAGKTTLLKRLAGEQPLENESETHSIAIREFLLKCARGQVRARAWDFGGQEILHSTHQFFLTERSLYLLVLEPRTGLAQRDAEYWLKLIDTQGSGSPVIVVMNWSHGRRWRVDEVKLRRKFPFIVDFLSTDGLHGDGIEELERCLAQTVEQRLQDVWLPFPTRWRAIKDAVASMHDNFLTYNQYAELCIRLGEDEPAAQSDLAGILHVLGLALYFGKDPRLHDTRVLNPGWVTGGVYAVVRAPSVAAKDGQLAVSDIPRVLREAEKQKVIKASDYPGKSLRFILELMCAFQLCYASEEGKNPKFGFQRGADEGEMKPVRYLVPELLPEFEPEMKEQWEQSPVRLRYRYEVLAPGLIPRFIVRTHEFSDGAPHWRHGVVLRHAEAQALIRAESDQSELHVFVLGGDEETRRILVTIVRRELQSLHAEMRMQPVEELELTGEGKHWIGVKARYGRSSNPRNLHRNYRSNRTEQQK